MIVPEERLPAIISSVEKLADQKKSPPKARKTLMTQTEETKKQLANSKHYKQFTIPQDWVGQPLDPALIALGYELSPMQFTILKKVLRLGEGDKSREQDLKDIIGAANRQLELDEI